MSNSKLENVGYSVLVAFIALFWIIVEVVLPIGLLVLLISFIFS